jgi:two-component system C4-dicarboxylate transport response regulator DctD
VISDISMPEMSGFTLAQRLHAVKPELPVVLMTGGQADPEIAQIAKDFGAFAFLQKPFEARLLWSTVERALEGSSVAARRRAG